MHTYLKIGLACVILLVILHTVVAWAEKEPIIRPIDSPGSIPIIVGPVDPLITCETGNLNDPEWLIGNFLLPPEEYGLVFRPRATCPDCGLGVIISRIHVLLETSEACEMTMAVGLRDATLLTSGCYGPGPNWCGTGLTPVSIPGAGMWDVSLFISCPCLAPGRSYLLTVTIDDFDCDTGTVPELVTDGSPFQCTNWNNFGTGWLDLLAEWPVWPGNLLFFADATCCSPPLPAESRTWGAVKALFGN